MKPKTAITILVILFIVVFVLAGYLWYQHKKTAEDATNGQNANSQKQMLIERQIDAKVKERAQTIEDKINQEKQKQPSSLTQEDMDFIANPQKTVQKEIGN